MNSREKRINFSHKSLIKTVFVLDFHDKIERFLDNLSVKNCVFSENSFISAAEFLLSSVG